MSGSPLDEMPQEERKSYCEQADRFMEVTSRMCELSWKEEDHGWLSLRNSSVLWRMAKGRDELRQFDESDSGGSAPLLMDGRKKNSKGESYSLELRLRAPLCVFVEFDDVDMGIDPATGQRRSFFPDHDQKRHWVPIWRNNSHSHSEEGVSCEQFPLRLARASTHWKVAGRTLIPERLSVREKIAAVPGIGYVAVTRVRDVTWLLRA